MMPEVPVPADAKIRTPIEVKLKSQWHFDSRRRVFESRSGDSFAPRGDLPKATKIVYKVPALARATSSSLTKHEKDLQRYLQIILPEGESPEKFVDTVRAWPCVAEAHVAPRVSLPAAP
jgi:hypothetical protein